MVGIRSYLLSVMAAAMICALITMLVGEKTNPGKIIKMLCGILLVTVIVKPVIEIKVSDWSQLSLQIQEQCDWAVLEGEKQAKEAFIENTTKAIEERIKTEAEKIGCAISASVSWGEEMQMKDIILEGSISPYAKNRLSKWIQENLAIPEESQFWIG